MCRLSDVLRMQLPSITDRRRMCTYEIADDAAPSMHRCIGAQSTLIQRLAIWLPDERGLEPYFATRERTQRLLVMQLQIPEQSSMSAVPEAPGSGGGGGGEEPVRYNCSFLLCLLNSHASASHLQAASQLPSRFASASNG